MIQITDKNKEKCCGCTACANICPKGAITMQEDFEGFLYPVVDKEKCIQCGLCEKVCPIKNQSEKKTEPEAYAVRVKDKKILETSTSGGFFTPVAKEILKRDGIVVGVAYGENMRVEHILVSKENEEKLELLRGSKYVQSYLGDMFKKIEKLLKDGKVVLFSGTPCQVNGLINFLKKDYENLITIDLICHGVPSPKLWKKYVEYQEKKNKSKIKQAAFRNKTYGYHSGTMKLVFENGKKYYGSARVDYMLKSFFAEISSRPACYECAFKTKYHVSDFTIFDCWSVSKLVENLKDDDKGYTNVMVNTQKGKQLLKEIENQIEIYPTHLEESIQLDGPMVEKSAIPHKDRNEFYQSLNEHGLEKTIKKYIYVSKKDKVIESSKKIVYKAKILNKIKELEK